MTQVRLERVGGIATAATVLVAIAAVAGVANWLVAVSVEGDARDFLDGRISNDDFATSLLAFSLVGIVSGAATVASAIVVIVWMHRIASNHRALHRTGTWGPGWAIGGWFLPPFLYVIPYLILTHFMKLNPPAFEYAVILTGQHLIDGLAAEYLNRSKFG